MPPHPIQVCQQLEPFPETPKSPTPENRGRSHFFHPHYLPSNPATTYNHLLPNVSRLGKNLQNMTLQARPEHNAYVTDCLVCGKPYDQLIKRTVAGHLHQSAKPG